MQKWEYLTLHHMWDEEKQEFYWGKNNIGQKATDEMLTIVGAMGWELVTVRPFALNPSAFYHFKRPLSMMEDQ